MFGFGSKSIVGLDVGSSSIKAVELKKSRGGIEVAHLGLEPLPPEPSAATSAATARSASLWLTPARPYASVSSPPPRAEGGGWGRPGRRWSRADGSRGAAAG